jgi:hypothetical protein
MKIIVEAGSISELVALLKEMAGQYEMAPKNIPAAVEIMTPEKKAAPKKVGGEFKNMENGKAPAPPVETPVEEPAPVKTAKEPELPVLTRDDVLAKVKVVKAGSDPDIGEKVKAWLKSNALEKLADCSNFQFHKLIKELGL